MVLSNGATSARTWLLNLLNMSTMSFNYNQKDKKPIFTTASDTMATTTTESYNSSEGRNGNNQMDGLFSPLAPTFHSQRGNDLIELLTQHEPKAGDTAPPSTELDEEMLMNLRINGTSDMMFTEMDQPNNNNGFFMGGARQESDTSSNIWGDGSSMSGTGRNGESFDTFDFLVKSLSSANNYVSMLTREQMSVLRSIRPSVLYEFLLEVAKVRTDKRMRRALPNECAFCKNNGENEECYSSHALKDWRGRVLCPVLRAFRCPRCGATGDRAHTIKYCQENEAAGLERSNSFGGRRRSGPSSSLHLGGTPLMSGTPSAPPTPAPGTASMPHSSVWNNYGIN